MISNAFFFMLSIFLLWFGADWIVGSASKIARKYKVSDLVIGLTIVAFGTSAPEFLVTATAAFKGMSDISLSNVVGSNIFNLGFILGLMALIKPLPTNRSLAFRDTPLLLATTALILGLAYFDKLDRSAGVMLLAILGGYISYLMVHSRRAAKSLSGVVPEVDEDATGEVTTKDWLKLLAGFIGIALGGEFMVDSASEIARHFGVSNWVIGMTIVAAGTSLPELVTCLAASLKGRNEMLLGNLIGSDFFNFAGVLGLTCVLRPLEVTPEALPGLTMLVGMVGLVLIFIRSGWKVTRLEGAILISLSLGRWVFDFMG
ncbi:calcium/sodium antiporter [Maridesulfovibrio hydrothermalis]|uniref:Na+/Ca+ antiporter, CaCA family n=1 Tax=Maridesulfovibrio hydrothermalis AM13 = DSM 14728 TaxID=1121451 RepID=L0RC25_9BACT|nr:calcium/sodium antiporter [Maridesulfovibrio hydrothermalis]CCO23772.1 Na+/Ca+ antiporter, CaCA family [Maridesulfovibrio hydrothermalis AM13 = DSM 14728]